MLGEIRDSETAQMAIRAALTGHLVLSTIHTNSAWGTVSRLIDMEVPAFLLANTLNITVAQRLVRLLCPLCKKEEPFNQALFPKKYKYDKLPEKHFVSVGCDSCYHTGYKGRKAVYEVIPIDYEFSERIKMSQLDIGDLLKEKDIRSLSQSAFELFQSGFTSIEEIYSLLMNT
jgi:type IV pilus assembly protein PilB